MSRTELLLQKLLNVSLFVTITTFTLLIIDLLFAVMSGAISCGEQTVFCTISDGNAFYKGSLWTLFIIMMVFLIAARVIYTILQREAKLVDVKDYRRTLVKKENLEFSQTKIYSDIIKTKKSRYTDIDTPEEIIENETIEEDNATLRDRIKDIKLPFFTKRNLENSLKKEEKEEIDVIESDEILEDEVVITKKDNFFVRFLHKLKSIHWLFWKKEKDPNDVLEDETLEDGEEKTKKDNFFVRFLNKLKSINWLFWKKEKNQDDIELEETAEETVPKAKVVVAKTVAKKALVKEEIVTPKASKETSPVKPKPTVSKTKPVMVTKTKADIIEKIFEDSGLSKNKSNKFLGTFSKVITEELAKKNDVELDGIGLITTILMPAKEAVNPQTKQKIIVDAHHQVRMRFSEEFKEFVAENLVIVEETPLQETIEPVEIVKEELPIPTPKVLKEEVVEVPIPKPSKPKVVVITKTKADIIEKIFEESGLSKNKSNKFLGTFSKVITEELAKRNDVELDGIGLITTILIPAKEAVNPQTKQKIIVDAHHQVRMRFSDDYKKKFE